ncbi:L-dopachrome tautomerase-related protein [Sinomicrobium weinanense]|uniref:SMP-30/gluconolactonase/LRE family protein n=1 Tax=Sinomicrobium weinanense TaxID=2842200 RepID=A0A926Q302_9FLAO|nr:L-dopachrome tautomerase-related protein [Sinomicrobium weinanense]MBC9795491.1 SMP-30/gluconolactonase/LRE family protein [Sinomicrobium weinanense]MBU3123362.1 SMP-30/gluconolactonase/LRE family protein [Sinomicrobium weinanense]
MKRSFIVLVLIFPVILKAQSSVIGVASFKGVQVTGVTVTESGRIFANFPRWRKGVPFSIVEVFPDGNYKPYPDKTVNSWEVGDPAGEKFIGIQSVVASGEELYVLETANPMFSGIITSPKIYVYDLGNDTLKDTYVLPDGVVKEDSYVNDLRVDVKKDKIYLTDSKRPGLIIVDKRNRTFTRVLDGHRFTTAEADHLTFGDKPLKAEVHSDGIALDTKNDVLYFHALTGYTLYGIKTEDLLDPEKLKTVKPFKIKTAAPDGMIIDKRGNLYFADLENNKIQYLAPDRKTIETLVEGEDVRWADTFGVYDGYLYYTNSRIHEVEGSIDDMEFTINKVKLPE